MFRSCIFFVICCYLFSVANCSGDENNQKSGDANQHPINWAELEESTHVVAVYENPGDPEIDGRFSTDSRDIAAVVTWLKDNWSKFEAMQAWAILPCYKIQLVLRNLVSLEVVVIRVPDRLGKPLFLEHDFDPIVEFLQSPTSHQVKTVDKPNGRDKVGTGQKNNWKRNNANQHPINWKAFEERCGGLSAYEYGRPEGKFDWKHRKDVFNDPIRTAWKDPKTTAGMFSWLNTNWNRIPLSTEVGDATPSYKVEIFLHDGLKVAVDVYTVFDDSSKRPVYGKHDLDAIVDFLKSPNNFPEKLTDMYRSRTPFGESKSFIERHIATGGDAPPSLRDK